MARKTTKKAEPEAPKKEAHLDTAPVEKPAAESASAPEKNTEAPEKKTEAPARTVKTPAPKDGLTDEFLKEALLAGKYVGEEDITRAEAHAKSHHSSITEYLYNEQMLTKELLGQAIAEKLGEKFIDLAANPPPKETVVKIPKDTAREHRVILVDAEAPLVATDALDTSELKTIVAPLLSEKEPRFAFSFSDDIDRALSLYKETLALRFTEILKREQKVAPEIVEQIIEDAVELRASDIHLEPQEKNVIVRFRIDGVLEDAGELPKPQFENILNRIKIEARLRIDEHNRAQDGAIRYSNNNIQADLRVSILPTVTGEKVVMRLLGAYLRELTLSELGFSQAHQRVLTDVANRPYGMILTVGPTGSGKTTTLYALLKLLNDSSVNVTTIEDPVEYRIGHVNQVQVNAATGLTFDGGLRSIVRQDPDVILVGEIRDLETADLAVNAALTGHLLLSTFHANDSATVVPRLLDMKVEPFLLASTLSIIVAQRLLRRICTHCKVSETAKVADIVEQYPKLVPFLSGETLVVYRGKGCAKCNMTGYKGQMGIYEFIEVTPHIQETILREPSAEAIEKAAREEGTRSFFEDGLDKVLSGFTTFEELLRVALPPKSLAK